MSIKKKVLLCILDGWGESAPSKDNTIRKKASYFYSLCDRYPHTLLNASEQFVGLPDGQMGNSEVGHMTIGLGRILFQDLLRIHKAFDSGALYENNALQAIIDDIKKTHSYFHIFSLLSSGGVHSHIDHVINAISFLLKNNIKVVLHAALDGRDTPPQSAIDFISQINKLFSNNKLFKWGAIGGRYFMMDRDKRYERLEKAYGAMHANCSRSSTFKDPIEFIQKNYKNNIYDEFIEPAYNEEYEGIRDNDYLWVVNFRSDRIRQILESFLLKEFNAFKREKSSFKKVIGFDYFFDFLKDNPKYIALLPKQVNKLSIGEVISEHGLKQFRIAETEKYAHVTFFLNGGREKPFLNEDRVLINSPNVATYDLNPEMGAFEITEALENCIEKDKHQFIVVNYANADMVGHTGNIAATEKAIETLDHCLKRLFSKCTEFGYTMLITADHGNAEKMISENGEPLTSHTLNLVPFVIVDDDFKKNVHLRDGGLQDIAPTILDLMGIEQPHEMTGKSLISK